MEVTTSFVVVCIESRLHPLCINFSLANEEIVSLAGFSLVDVTSSTRSAASESI
jgi:hypothetical protein